MVKEGRKLSLPLITVSQCGEKGCLAVVDYLQLAICLAVLRWLEEHDWEGLTACLVAV